MFRCLSWVMACGLFFQSLSVATGDIIITGSSRGVTAGATGAPLDSDSTPGTGLYVKDATAIGGSPAGLIGSFAHQSSSVPGFIGPGMGGVGTADVFASATGFTGFSNIAESFFDVDFKVTSTGFYKFTASTEWIGGPPPPYGGFAIVELLDITHAVSIDSVTSTPFSPGIDSVTGMYFLIAGDDYRVSAEVEIAGGFATAGEYDAHGSWSFILAPEPGSLGLGCTALAFLAIRRRRK